MIPRESIRKNQPRPQVEVVGLNGLGMHLNKRKYIEKLLFVILNQPGHTLSLEEREQVGEIVYDGIPA